MYFSAIYVAVRTTGQIANSPMITQPLDSDSVHVVAFDNWWQHSDCAAKDIVAIVLPAVNNSDFTLIVLSPCSHCAL